VGRTLPSASSELALSLSKKQALSDAFDSGLDPAEDEQDERSTVEEQRFSAA
jgi:hypothetical protein